MCGRFTLFKMMAWVQLQVQAAGSGKFRPPPSAGVNLPSSPVSLSQQTFRLNNLALNQLKGLCWWGHIASGISEIKYCMIQKVQFEWNRCLHKKTFLPVVAIKNTLICVFFLTYILHFCLNLTILPTMQHYSQMQFTPTNTKILFDNF